MCSDFVTAGALGGIQGTLTRIARDQNRQNNMAGTLAQQVQVANHWQVTAFKLQKEVAEWQAWGDRAMAGWKEEVQVTADLRQQLEETQNRLAQAQEDLRVEKKLRHDEFNEGVENYNRLVRKSNRFLKCINTIKGQPADAIALITALEAEMKAQQG